MKKALLNPVLVPQAAGASGLDARNSPLMSADVAEIHRPLENGVVKEGALAHPHAVEVGPLLRTLKPSPIGAEQLADVRRDEIHRPFKGGVVKKGVLAHLQAIEVDLRSPCPSNRAPLALNLPADVRCQKSTGPLKEWRRQKGRPPSSHPHGGEVCSLFKVRASHDQDFFKTRIRQATLSWNWQSTRTTEWGIRSAKVQGLG